MFFKECASGWESSSCRQGDFKSVQAVDNERFAEVRTSGLGLQVVARQRGDGKKLGAAVGA